MASSDAKHTRFVGRKLQRVAWRWIWIWNCTDAEVVFKLLLIWARVLHQYCYYTFTHADWLWLLCEWFAKMLYSGDGGRGWELYPVSFYLISGWWGLESHIPEQTNGFHKSPEQCNDFSSLFQFCSFVHNWLNQLLNRKFDLILLFNCTPNLSWRFYILD